MASKGDDRRTERLAILGIGTAAGIALAVVYDQLLPVPGGSLNRITAMFSKVAYWFTWSALAVAVLWFAQRVPVMGPRWRRALLIHALGSVVFAFAHMRLWTLVVTLWLWRIEGLSFSFEQLVTDVRWIKRLFAYWTFEWEIMLYWSIVGLAHAIVYRHESREGALTAARLDAELSLTRLHVLQQQMHPHFLFNTLQSISALMHRSVTDAEEMIVKLGELLRGSLRVVSGTELVPLRRELEYVAHYVCIEQMNLGDRLQVRQDVSPDVLQCRVPELLLQPLVENAVRHGIAPLARGGTVGIAIRRNETSLHLSVTDDGVGLQSGKNGGGIALENIRRRLALLFPSRHDFDIAQGPSGIGVIVRITIPIVENP